MLLEQAYVKLPGGDVNGTVAKVKALCSGGAQNLLVSKEILSIKQRGEKLNLF